MPHFFTSKSELSIFRTSRVFEKTQKFESRPFLALEEPDLPLPRHEAKFIDFQIEKRTLWLNIKIHF